METFCKSWPAACWPPVTFSCASRKSFPRQHVKSTHHHGGDDDSDDVDGDVDDGDDVDGDDQYDNNDLGNKLKAAQGLADFQTFIATSWQGRSRQSPSFVFGNLSDFLCQSKEGWRHKVGEQSRKSELVPVNRISLTTQQPHFRRTLNPRDKNQVVCLINCFLQLKEGTDCIKENDLFEMFFGGLLLWGHWLCLRD